MPESSREARAPGVTERLVARVRREHGAAADAVVDTLVTDLGPVLATTAIDPERIMAAVVLSARGDARRLRDARALAHEDVRDLLHGGGLAGSDWREVLDHELGADGAGPSSWTAPKPGPAGWWTSGPAVFLAALLVCLAAFGWLAWRDAAADELLREGERVEGVVTDVDYGTTRIPASFDVRYAVGGREHEATIHGQRPVGTYDVGDRVVVVVDPGDPTRVRTVDESNTRSWPATLVLVLAVVLALGLVAIALVVVVGRLLSRRSVPAARTHDRRERSGARRRPPGPWRRSWDRWLRYYRAGFAGHVLSLLVVLGVACGCALWLEQRSSDALLEEGVPVAGTVERFDRDEQGRTVGMDVRYAVDGSEHVARVVVGNGHVYEPGQEVTVLVDPDEPTHVRTPAEANTRLDWGLVVPLAVAAWLALLVLGRAWRAVRRGAA